MPRPRSRRRINAKGRNETEQYVNLTYAMLNSDAWRSLSGAAAKVWLELRTRFRGGNNGRLILSLEEAARLLHIGKATALSALRELEEKGFVVRTRRGQWYGRLASQWAVTDKGVDGAMPTYAWRHWRPLSVPMSAPKTEGGFDTDPSHVSTGRLRHRAAFDGPESEPVVDHRGTVVGFDTNR